MPRSAERLAALQRELFDSFCEDRATKASERSTLQRELFGPHLVLERVAGRSRAKSGRPATPRLPQIADSLDLDPELAQVEAQLDAERPRLRADCVDAARPCPWLGCRYHLWHERPRRFERLIDDESVALADWGDTCTLDVADRVDWRWIPARADEPRGRRIPFVTARLPPELVQLGGLRIWQVHAPAARAIEVDNALTGRLLGHLSREQVRIDLNGARAKVRGLPELAELLARSSTPDAEGDDE